MFQIGRLNIVKSDCIKIPKDLLKKKKKRARERERERERERQRRERKTTNQTILL